MNARLNQANGRLRSAKVGVSIELQGNRLYVRATLPPKPLSNKVCSYQQRISLGVRNTISGISYAEREARKIGALLDCKQFDWSPYLKEPMPKLVTVADWVERFHTDYFSKRALNPKSETTWKGDYLKVFRQLPQDQVLSVDLVKKAILRTDPDTKTRKRTCMVMGALAKFAALDFDPKPLAGNYSPSKVTRKDLPTDEQIAEHYSLIVNPQWRWFYGVCATYGLRPHEVFRLDLDELREGKSIVTVLSGKTGSRRVWPYYPEWVDAWHLSNVKLPPISLDRANVDIGHSCTRYFQGKIPFKLYDLRRCWAVRTLEFGLDVTLAAQQMGHSVQVHTEQYHAWITERHHQAAYDLMMTRTDRPKAPSMISN
jgi:integrase